MPLVYITAPLAIGLIIGYLLRERKLPNLDKFSVVVIVILIFSLGFGIGANNELIAALPQVGVQALVIAVLTIAFSILFVKVGKKAVKAQ